MSRRRPLGWLQKLALGLLIYVVLEIFVTHLLSGWIGGVGVFLLMVGTAVLGGMLVRTRGRRIWEEVQQRQRRGEPPGHALLDGLCMLAGALLLILPGFIGDAIGLTLLLPITRIGYRRQLRRMLEHYFRNGGGRFFIFRR